MTRTNDAALRSVEKATREYGRSKETTKAKFSVWVAAIVAAAGEGATRRDIARVAGIGPTRVHQLCERWGGKKKAKPKP